MSMLAYSSERSFVPSPWSLIFIYLLVRGPQFEKPGLENFEQLLYLCIFWILILITASNYQLYMDSK